MPAQSMENNAGANKSAIQLTTPPTINYIDQAIKESSYNKLLSHINQIDAQLSKKTILLENKDTSKDSNFIENLILFMIAKLKRDYTKITAEHYLPEKSQVILQSLHKKKLQRPVIITENLNDISSAQAEHVSNLLDKLANSYLVIAHATQIATLADCIKKLFTAPVNTSIGFIKKIIPYDQKAATLFKVITICNQLFAHNASECASAILEHSNNPNLESFTLIAQWLKDKNINCLKSNDFFSDNKDKICLQLWSLLEIKNNAVIPELLSFITVHNSQRLLVEHSPGKSSDQIFVNVIELDEIVPLINHYNEIDALLS